MTYQFLQNMCQIAIAVGIIVTALGGYGSYHYGKKVDKEKNMKEENYNIDTLNITGNNGPTQLNIGSPGSQMIVSDNYRFKPLNDEIQKK